MRLYERIEVAGVLLIGAGFLILYGDQRIEVVTNAATAPGAPAGDAATTGSYLGYGTLALGFLTLASSHYFKLRDARRADRAEAREIHDRRNKSTDTQ
jgi:hypothetical protein